MNECISCGTSTNNHSYCSHCKEEERLREQLIDDVNLKIKNVGTSKELYVNDKLFALVKNGTTKKYELVWVYDKSIKPEPFNDLDNAIGYVRERAVDVTHEIEMVE